jgi:hypothetical protein
VGAAKKKRNIKTKLEQSISLDIYGHNTITPLLFSLAPWAA